MKSVPFLFVLLFSISTLAQSPISKGTINLNGSLSFSSQSYEEGIENRNVITLNPQLSYFFIDNISPGLSVTYDRVSLGSAGNTNLGKDLA